MAKVAASALTLLFGYILVATYAAKLIALYSGFTARTTLAAIAELYGQHPALVFANLNLVTLGPAEAVFCLIAAIFVLEIILIRRMLRNGQHF